MKKTPMILRTLAGLALFGALIQAVPMPRANPPVESNIPVPGDVQAILRASCYDCHSNETTWPWYSRVAPVSWLVARDVADGRRHLNFSTWNRYPPERQAKFMARIIREVRKGDMPPWFYVIKHADAKLTPERQAALEAWAGRRP
jgi:hypothetical protein